MVVGDICKVVVYWLSWSSELEEFLSVTVLYCCNYLVDKVVGVVAFT